jgi:hypothetical protein
MITNLRIWRVVPTSKTGVQAPTFFVETTEEGREKAEKQAISLAKQRSALSTFDCWNFNVTKMAVRVKNGKYIPHHQ